MNILEEEDVTVNLLKKCKALYLEKENLWMSKEIETINELIVKYKTIIQAQSQQEDSQDVEAIIAQARLEIEEIVQSKMQEYESIRAEQAEPTEEDITQEEFDIIVAGYEEKVLSLQEDIVNREMELQHIEDNKQV